MKKSFHRLWAVESCGKREKVPILSHKITSRFFHNGEKSVFWGLRFLFTFFSQKALPAFPLFCRMA